MQRARRLARLAELVERRGVLRVYAKLIRHERVQTVVAPVLRFELLAGAAPAAQHRAKTAVDGRLRDRVAEVVHVERRGDAAGEVFEDGQLRKHVDVLRRELVLQRDDFAEEPVLQRQIVGIGAHEAHARMCVRVFEARHQQVAAQVDLAFKGGHVRFRRADVGNGAAVHPDLVRRDRRRAGHGQRPAVKKSNHGCPSQFKLDFFIIPPPRRLGNQIAVEESGSFRYNKGRH